MTRKDIHKVFFQTKGYSLLEILIAGFIGFLVLAACYVIFLSHNQAALRNEERMDITGSVNVGMNLLTRDLRMAGFGGVDWLKEAAIVPMNNVNVAGGFQTTSFNGGFALAGDIKPGTDAFLLLHTDRLCSNGVQVHNLKPFYNVGSGTDAGMCQPNCFDTGLSDPIEVGDVALIIGNQGGATAGIFVSITSIDNSADAGASGICSGAPFYSSIDYAGIDELSLPIKKDCQSGTPCLFQKLYRLEMAYVYYIDNQNRLKRMPIDVSMNPATNSQVVVEGVEDLQAMFNLIPGCHLGCWGTCQNANADDTLPLANGTAGCDNGQNDYLRILEIRSVRFAMVFKSLKEDRVSFYNQGAPIDLAAYGFDHSPASATDSFRRAVATQTIRIKNLELLDF